MIKVNLTITKTKKGLEYLGASFTDKKGKRQRKALQLLNTPQNKKVAETILIPKLQLALNENNGEFFNNNIPTVYDFALKSINMNKSKRNNATHNDYVSILENHIKDVLGNKKLDKVKPSDIKQWQTDLIEIKKLSPARVKTCRKVLSKMYNDALDDEIVNKNPLTRVPSPTITLPEITPFTADEVVKIIDNAEGQIQSFVATAFLTGARSGELLGLKWEDIDFDRQEISIKRSIRMGVIGKTKTSYSVRTIDMLDSLVPYLQNQFKLTGSKNSFVFLNKEGNHIYDIKRIRNTHWKKLLIKCGLEYKTIYHTRHTFATMMIEHEDVLWISQMLGHRDSTITLKHYAKYFKKPEVKRGSFINSKMSFNDNQIDNQNKKVA